MTSVRTTATWRPRGTRAPPLAAALMAVATAGALLGSVPAASAAPRADVPARCPSGVSFQVGAASADITPPAQDLPIAEAAYSIGRVGVAAAHPFLARALAIRSCTDGATVVVTAVDSQGYFTAYKEDPAGAATDPTQGLGTTAVRAIVARDTGVPATNVIVSATHTHNSPDSVGIWDGGSNPAAKAYLSVVRAGAVRAIEDAVAGLRPAHLSVGTADISSLVTTLNQVRRDPTDYPVDHTLRVLQATAVDSCAPIATLVNAGVHATVAGEIGPDHQHDLLEPDWPGRVATDLEASLPGETAVVVPGAVGRTQPRFPTGTDPHGDALAEIAAYGDVMARRAATAVSTAAPVTDARVAAVDAHLPEPITEPALIPLFASETGVPGTIGGIMRSSLPPYSEGTVLDAEVQTFRVGGLMIAGTPGEPYPEVATELATRVSTAAPTFAVGLANDQLGYTPPGFEVPYVATADGGDEGIFTINPNFGDDVINQHLSAARGLGFPVTPGLYDGANAGPVQPPDQQSPPGDPASDPEPSETPLALGCSAAPVGVVPEAPAAAVLPLLAVVALLTVVRQRRRRRLAAPLGR